ncbi:hypothetical protein P3S67_002774 [Capsicum chacoense]
MMMSIFSSFDALSTDIFGQKVTRSWSPATSDNKQQPGVGPTVSDRKTAAVSPPSTSSIGGLNEAAPRQLQNRLRGRSSKGGPGLRRNWMAFTVSKQLFLIEFI